MRPPQIISVTETIDLVTAGCVPSTEAMITLLMAVRERSKGQLRDLADCAAHDPRDKGQAHNHIKSFVHMMTQGLSRSPEAKGGRIRVLHPIRNVIAQLNQVLATAGIERQIDAKDQRSRMVLAYSIAYALHDTSFDLGDEHEARLTFLADGTSDAHMGVDVTFPELGAPRTHPIVLSFPWLLDERDLTADWSEVQFLQSGLSQDASEIARESA